MDTLDAARTDQKRTLTLAASSGVTRTDVSNRMGGYSNFNTENRFRYYQQLSVCTPHVSTSLNKLALSLVKGMHFDGKYKSTVENFERWAKRVNFVEQAQTLARLLCRDGTYIAVPEGQPENMVLKPLYMPAVCIWPKGFDPNPGQNTLLTPPAEKIVANEGMNFNGVKEESQEISRVVYGTYNAWDSVQKDVKGRDTWGLYGASMLDPIELSIRNLLNVNQGYVSFVQKYGNGRYVINFELLEQLVEKELISIEDAQQAIDDWLENHKNLKQNEDIVGAGLSVVPIDATGTLDVLAFKKSLETDIQIGLLQTPLSMGDTKGSTYAAGYVSEADRMVVLEGMQKFVQNILQQAINRRLEMLNKPDDSVWIEFEELSRPQMEARDVLEWYNSGVLTREQLLYWGGFPQEGE
ncbi:MAG: hypothetical protein Q8J68_08875 [Methanolobus sp.]|uniref:hypothetical protein n=1 Tax=Methanolobus sp. TaxID=1874737 RepID=UPI0027319722|nr:hypothetical protein [Methanolobus sp.]MDP2217385.1 hypothetical protein [Methanolobus sp.]